VLGQLGTFESIDFYEASCSHNLDKTIIFRGKMLNPCFSGQISRFASRINLSVVLFLAPLAASTCKYTDKDTDALLSSEIHRFCQTVNVHRKYNIQYYYVLKYLTCTIYL